MADSPSELAKVFSRVQVRGCAAVERATDMSRDADMSRRPAPSLRLDPYSGGGVGLCQPGSRHHRMSLALELHSLPPRLSPQLAQAVLLVFAVHVARLRNDSGANDFRPPRHPQLALLIHGLYLALHSQPAGKPHFASSWLTEICLIGAPSCIEECLPGELANFGSHPRAACVPSAPASLPMCSV
eukprot:COSAG01_NODE_11555_length_1904_cov_2.407756_2_plen_185_part_00